MLGLHSFINCNHNFVKDASIWQKSIKVFYERQLTKWNSQYKLLHTLSYGNCVLHIIYIRNIYNDRSESGLGVESGTCHGGPSTQCWNSVISMRFVIKGFGDRLESALVHFLVSEAQNAPGHLECKVECDEHHKMGRKDAESPAIPVGGWGRGLSPLFARLSSGALSTREQVLAPTSSARNSGNLNSGSEYQRYPLWLSLSC